MIRIGSQILGGAAIVLVFFFGTLFILNWWDRPPDLDPLRASHAKQIGAALEAYRRKTGHYPTPFPDNPLADIQKDIGASLPQDPGGSANQYRYVSIDGNRYGLLFHLQGGGTCVSGVGVTGTGWWLNAPECK